MHTLGSEVSKHVATISPTEAALPSTRRGQRELPMGGENLDGRISGRVGRVGQAESGENET